MPAQSKPFCQRPSRRFVCVAMLVVCALLAHSLDNCAAHFSGGLRSCADVRQADVRQSAAPCPDAGDFCEICAQSDEPHKDVCDLLSETAVLVSSQHSLEQQAVTFAATVAVVPVRPPLLTRSGCLHNRAGPPPAWPLGVFLRSSLSSRAPPVWA